MLLDSVALVDCGGWCPEANALIHRKIKNKLPGSRVQEVVGNVYSKLEANHFVKIQTLEKYQSGLLVEVKPDVETGVDDVRPVRLVMDQLRGLGEKCTSTMWNLFSKRWDRHLCLKL